MFSAHCPGCGTEILLSTRRIVRLDSTDRGILVVFRCWQGHLGTWLTGRAANGRRPSGPADARHRRRDLASAGTS